LASPNPLSTRHQQFACARLSQSCLSKSYSDFSATFTTVAFDDSSSRWLGISDLIAEPEGPSFISRTVAYRRVEPQESSPYARRIDAMRARFDPFSNGQIL
jgi:hypothetical protein